MTDDRLGGPKQRLVLSVLVRDLGRVVGIDHLVSCVWGRDVDDRSRASLRAYVSRLRRALRGVASIEHRHDGYVLEATGIAPDHVRFERIVAQAIDRVGVEPDEAAEDLRTALGMWRGPPFGDLTREAALTDEVARLENLRLCAFETLTGVEIDRGRHEGTIAELRRLVDERPLREPLRRLLLLALYRSGRQAEALAEYERLRVFLAEELGADPSGALQSLHVAMLRHDPALDGPRGPAPTGRSARRTVEGGVPTGGRRRLVGRDAELTVAARLLPGPGDGVPGRCDDRARVLLVGGEAGIGKSRLVEELGELATAAGADVLVGRCLDLGGTAVPLAPATQLLRAVVRAIPAEQLDAALGPARHELAGLVPRLGTARAAADAPDAPGRLYGAFADVLRRLARRRPRLVVLEDVHWADTSTLDLLVFLAHELEDEPLVLVATFRTDELHGRRSLRAVLGELSRLRAVTRIDLGPLADPDAAELVRDALGAAPAREVVEAIVARGSGNPFYLEELAAASREDRPAAVGTALHDVVAARLAQLPEQSRRLVEIVAVAGGAVDERLLARVAGEDPLVVDDLLRPTVHHHVLVPSERGYRFRHDIVREVVLGDLLPGARAALHCRVATALEDDPSLAEGGAEHADAELAHHWDAAHDEQHAFVASLRAADAARRAGAYEEAMLLGERALELWPRIDRAAAPTKDVLLERLARSTHLAGHYGRAITLLRRALGEVGDDPVREAELLCAVALAEVLDGRGGRGGAQQEVARAVALVGDVDPSRRTARVLNTAARVLIVCEDLDRAAALARDALRVARAAGDESGELHARISLGTVLAGTGRDVEEGLAELRTCLRLARRRGDAETVGRALNNLLFTTGDALRGDAAHVDDLIEEAVAWLRESRHRESSVSSILLNTVAHTALVRGAPDRAEGLVASVDVSALEGYARSDLLLTRARTHLVRGRLEEAVADAVSAMGARTGDRLRTDRCLTVLAFVAAERGDLTGLRRIVGDFEELPVEDDHAAEVLLRAMRLRRVLVRAEVDTAIATLDPTRRADHLAAARRAARMVHEEHEQLRAAGSGVAPLVLERAGTEAVLTDAELGRGDGDDPEAWRAVVDRPVSPYQRVYARHRLGVALLGAGSRSTGVRTLADAHRSATAIGATLLRQRVERVAAEHGVALTGDPPDD